MKAWYKLISLALCAVLLTGCVILTPQETGGTGESTTLPAPILELAPMVKDPSTLAPALIITLSSTVG